MASPHFADRLIEAIRRKGNAVLVGIDPRPERLPKDLLARFPNDLPGTATALEAFSREIVDVVAPLVPAVKFQAAFFEALGPPGCAALHASARHAQDSGLIVILDGKRNDIGSTAEAYARAYLGHVGNPPVSPWPSDALTINPYLGSDGIKPFLDVARVEGRGVFVLVRTSNASAVEFQDLIAEGKPLYRHVADRLASLAEPLRGSSHYSLAGAVVGATYPEQLAELRQCLPGVLFLVPGYGAQGGTARDVAPAFDDEGLGAVVNNSRGIAFAYERPEFQSLSDWRLAVERAAKAMIDDLAEHTPAGQLRTAV